MIFSSTLGALALCGVVSAFPAADNAPEPTRLIEKRVDKNLPWVSIDTLGQPATTYTPTVTTVNGAPSDVNPAPYELTGTVFSTTNYGIVHTSTGEPPNPRATGSNGAGVFQKCVNKDPATAPFCRPFANSTLLTGNEYYITWDVSYYNDTTLPGNSTMVVRPLLEYLNTRSNQRVLLKDDYDAYDAVWGFARLPVNKDLLKDNSGLNITITLVSFLKGYANKNKSSIALPIIVAEHPFPEKANEKLPSGSALYIGIPVAFGSVILLVCGGFWWNRKKRRIQLGNIMSRSRHGYSGRTERRKMFGGNAKDNGGIQLDPHDDFDANVYRDDVPQHGRHDSDGLGSLAGSPVNASFQQQGTTGGRNAFRDEVDRQNNERHNDRR